MTNTHVQSSPWHVVHWNDRLIASRSITQEKTRKFMPDHSYRTTRVLEDILLGICPFSSLGEGEAKHAK